MPLKNDRDRREYNRKYQREWVRRNREKRNATVAKARHRLRKWLTEYKVERGCKRCGERHPAVLEFHHRNQRAKEGDLANMPTKRSFVSMQREVAKCDVLCANCHRKVHHEERLLKETA